MQRRIFAFFILILCFASANAQVKYDVYYLCVGSAHYEQDFSKYRQGFTGLLNVPEARTSALKMQELFDKELNAESGKVLLSEHNRLLTREAMMGAVQTLVKQVKKEKAPNPLIIFYYCGHGFSSRELEGHYLPPGNFVHNPDSLGIDEWGEYAIAALDIYEALVNSGISFIMLLDCCHSGEQSEPEMLNPYAIKNLGLETMDQLIRDIYIGLKAMNRMVGYEPVVFSASAGNSVATVRYAFNDGEQKVGPLCRKSYITLAEKLNNADVISVNDFIKMLADPAIDSATTPAVTFWNFDKKNLGLIKQ